jgi:iron complex transport system permease protein
MDQLPSIVFWLLGGISTSNWRVVLQIAPITLICIILLYLFRWRINVYALNDSVLYSLGVKRKGEVYLILGISVLLTTSIISFSGLVGWVGLIIPNITRLSFGYDLRSSLPASILLGAIFVLVSDTISRTLIAGEIPLGIITAFLGAIVFVILIFGKGFPLSKNG